MKNKRTTLLIFITIVLMIVILVLTNCTKNDPDPINGAPVVNVGSDQKVEIRGAFALVSLRTIVRYVFVYN